MSSPDKLDILKQLHIKMTRLTLSMDTWNGSNAALDAIQNAGYKVLLNVYWKRIKNADGTYRNKNKLANECWKMQQGNVITWDGLVVPCCFDKDATHRLGNLKTQSFKEIWNNDNYKQFRSDIQQSRKNIDICANCSEGASVWK